MTDFLNNTEPKPRRRKGTGIILVAVAAVAMLAGSAGAASAAGSFVLYRSGVGLPDLRIHVASFDAVQNWSGGYGSDAAYNSENCQTAASLFRSQPGVSVSYWCEPKVETAGNGLWTRLWQAIAGQGN
ncbi:hypothetical protein [Rhizobium sp. RAF56]|uniref:hypothetical protein n=1 Tax=Rhizobium sp. RAF56 TaxID=3233062 RepID=UPI003F9B4AB1